jgi:hypothetical protein
MLLALIDFHSRETAEAQQIQAADFGTPQIRAFKFRARQFGSKEIATAQHGVGQIGGRKIRLAKAAIREVALRQTSLRQIGELQIAAPERGTCHNDLPAIGMAEVDLMEARAPEVAVIHFNREQI